MQVALASQASHLSDKRAAKERCPLWGCGGLSRVMADRPGGQAILGGQEGGVGAS